MLTLYHELEILSKAVHFKNLSAAAKHVGLSQPQLSRIIARLEVELSIVLLDRTAKRKSSWTPVAFSLAKVFEKSWLHLQREISSLNQNQIQSELHLGTLEGLSSIALQICHHCFWKVGVKKIHCHVLDISDLESRFSADHLDLILTSKLPTKQKFKYIVEVGAQELEFISTSQDVAVYSSFEFSQNKKTDTDKYEYSLVSNSLSLRKEWFKKFGGTGYLPSEVFSAKTPHKFEPVLLIGSELLNPSLWSTISNLKLF